MRGGGLSDGTLFEGIESAMVYMLEDHVPEIRAEIRRFPYITRKKQANSQKDVFYEQREK